MPASSLPVSPPEITSLLTSLGVFSLAVAAVVAGIYKGIKDIGKGNETTGDLDKRVTVRVSDSLLAELTSALKETARGNMKLVEALQDSREMTRSQLEEQHRLRAATVDLVEMLRRHNL